MNDDLFRSFEDADAFGAGPLRALLEDAVGPVAPDAQALIAGAMAGATQLDPDRRTRLRVLAVAALALLVLGTWATLGLLTRDRAEPVIDPDTLEPTSAQTLAGVLVEHLQSRAPDPLLVRANSEPVVGATTSARVVVSIDGQPLDFSLTVYPPLSDAELVARGIGRDCGDTQVVECQGTGRANGGGDYVTELEFPLSGVDRGFAVRATLVTDDRVVVARYTVDVNVAPCGSCAEATFADVHPDVPAEAMAQLVQDVRLVPETRHGDNAAAADVAAVWQADPASGPAAATAAGVVAALQPHLADRAVTSFDGLRGTQEAGLVVRASFEGSSQQLSVFVLDPGPFTTTWRSCTEFEKHNDPASGDRCTVLADGSVEFRSHDVALLGAHDTVTVLHADRSSTNARLYYGKRDEPVLTLDDLAAIANDPAIGWVMPAEQASAQVDWCPSLPQEDPCWVE